jgi:hypothetical protein
MTEAPATVSPDQAGRTAQIVVGALMMGLLTMGAVAFVVAQDKGGEASIVSWIAAGFFGLMVIVSFFLPRTTAAQFIRELAANAPRDWRAGLAPLYLNKTIQANAMLEGSGFFNAIAFLIDGHWLNLAIVGAILVLMAITFPSQSKFESWAEQVQREHSS